MRKLVAFLFCALLVNIGVVAQDSVGEPGAGGSGPNPLKNVYFGEQHLRKPIAIRRHLSQRSFRPPASFSLGGLGGLGPPRMN